MLRRHHASVRRNLGYLLWDPEVGNFSYRVVNVPELLSAIADATRVPLATLEGFAREAAPIRSYTHGSHDVCAGASTSNTGQESASELDGMS